jgi:hypothetical protein
VFWETQGDVSLPRRNAKEAIIADVDPKGDVQGADAAFTEALKNKSVFDQISGYASWNTAGNTIGTALPHGILFSLSRKTFGIPAETKMTRAEYNRRSAIMSRVGHAQTWFLLNRLLDDYVYHTLVRPEAIKYARSKNWNVFRFNDEQTKAVEEFAAPRVRNQVWQNLNPISRVRYSQSVCENVEDFKFWLPWGRTFEAEIDFKLSCTNPYKIEKGVRGTRPL